MKTKNQPLGPGLFGWKNKNIEEPAK